MSITVAAVNLTKKEVTLTKDETFPFKNSINMCPEFTT